MAARSPRASRAGSSRQLSGWKGKRAYTKDWLKLYNNGLLIDEGRAITVQSVDGTYSTYVVGTSAASSNGQDFCTWRYKE